MEPNRSWSTAYMNELPDSAFLYVEPGGRRDGSGRTVPRTLRHFPFKDERGRIDLPHLRNALSRIPQSSLSSDVRIRVEKKAQKLLARHGGYAENPPPPPPRRGPRLPTMPRSRLDVHRRPSSPRRAAALERIRTMAEEHEERERPFDPERAPTWHGSSRELVVNPQRGRREILLPGDLELIIDDDGTARVWTDDDDQFRFGSYAVGELLAEKGYRFAPKSEWVEVDYGWERELRPKSTPNAQRRNGSEVTQVYINPYVDSSKGFYASSKKQYLEGVEKLQRRGIEEYEVDFIDGSSAHAALFKALKIGPSDVELWFDTIEDLDDDQMAALYHRAELGVDWREDLDEIESRTLDPWPREGTVRDYAEQLVDDIGVESVSNPEFYFDFESFGRDLRISGDLEAGAEDEEERERLGEHYEGMSDRAIGEEVVDDMYGGVSELPKEVSERYFDYDKLARDMEIGGDVDEFKLGDTTYNIDTR